MDIAGFIRRYQGLSPATLAAYGESLRQLERFIGGKGEPTDAAIRLFLQGVANASYLQRHKAAFKRYYTFRGRAWLFDPMEFKRPRHHIPRGLSRGDIEKIIAEAKDEHEYMAIKTLFILGIRSAELMAMTPDCLVDDADGMSGARIVGKRNKERFVPVADQVFWQELKRYATQFSVGERMFPLDGYDYRRMLRRMCEYAGVKRITLHQVRHSRALDLLNKGMKPNELQQFLGHESPTTTMIYLRVGSAEVGDALKRIGE